MNKKYLIILILMIIGLFFASQYLTSAERLNGKEIVKIIEFSTDKDVYSSREKIISYLEVESLKDIKNVNFILEGIKPYNTAHLKDSKLVDLKKGKNEITFEGMSPYCTSGCGGVYPGDYDITVEVFENENLIASSKVTITLVSG